ncbi:MAG: 3-hydroxyacyl-ACP dehydratase [Bacteroidia bacterium]|nr:3-hydroxyacyl-ACP dehydratase [Bacteroidia bacterium]
MLLGDFFTIHYLEETGFDIKAGLVINAGHKIFEGHFPGQPVVPGVCMMQIVKEIMEKVIGKKTNLIRAHEMKFLAIINPQENNIIQAALKYNIEETGNIVVSATLFKDELTHFKFKGLFAFQEAHP